MEHVRLLFGLLFFCGVLLFGQTPLFAQAFPKTVTIPIRDATSFQDCRRQIQDVSLKQPVVTLQRQNRISGTLGDEGPHTWICERKGSTYSGGFQMGRAEFQRLIDAALQ